MKQLLVSSVVVLSLAPSVCAQEKDILFKIGSGRVSGEVIKVSPDAVSIKSSGATQEVPVDEIDRVIFGDDPSGLATVRRAVVNGQLEDAKTRVDTIKAAGRPFVQQDLSFYKALIEAKLALNGKADVKDAARLVGGFLKSSPNSFRYYEGCEMMGKLALSLGRFDSASRYFDKLAKAKSSGLSARGALLLGDAMLLSGDPGKAEPMYRRCRKSTDARLQAMGELGVAICQAETAQGAANAIPSIEKVINENDSSDAELFARAYNALGKSYLTTGNTEAALDAYLHTDLLFYRDSEKHAEALFQLAKLWAEVNKPAEASRARQTLKQRYPTSAWAKR